MRKTKKNERCWKGYKPTPGKKPYSPGSCMKEAVDAQALANAYLQMANVLAEEGLGRKIGKAAHSARIKAGHAMMKAGGTLSPEKGSKPSTLSKVRKRLGAALQNRGSKMLQRAERDADIYEAENRKERRTAALEARFERANLHGRAGRGSLHPRTRLDAQGKPLPGRRRLPREIKQAQVNAGVEHVYTTLAYLVAEMKEKTPAEQRARIEQARKITYQRNLPDDSPHKKPRIPGQRKRVPGSTLAQASRLERKVDARQRKRQEELEAEAERQDESKKGVMPKMKMGVHKSREGGLTQKGVEAYRAANPGSKLKTAVTTKPSKLKKGSKAAKRRKSFCSRMGGMKKRLTSSKTANDPNSRINKALRKWNC